MIRQKISSLASRVSNYFTGFEDVKAIRNSRARALEFSEDSERTQTIKEIFKNLETSRMILKAGSNLGLSIGLYTLATNSYLDYDLNGIQSGLLTIFTSEALIRHMFRYVLQKQFEEVGSKIEMLSKESYLIRQEKDEEDLEGEEWKRGYHD